MAAQRGRARAVRLVPFADREQRLDLVRDEHGAVDPVPADHLEPRLLPAAPIPWPSSFVSTSVKIDVRAFQAERITDLLGELQGLTK